MNSRLSIAILDSHSNRIGLFSIVRIHQLVHNNIETLTWIKYHHSPFSEFVRPYAILYNDPAIPTIHSEPIQVITSDFLRLDRNGNIQQNHILYASLIRLPYIVSFWEEMDSFPVYSLNPDFFLPWTFTVQSAVRYPLQIRPIVDLSTDSESDMAIDEPLPSSSNSPPPIRRDMPRILSATAVCPIRLELLTMEAAYWTPCGHAFSDAILIALERDPRCPLCRHPCSLRECSVPSHS